MSFVVEDHGERPLTVNKVATLHRMAWAKHTNLTRQRWQLLAVEAKLPRALDAVSVTVTPLHKDRRSPQDCASAAPSAKAAIDGLVDYGLIVDDDATHLVSVTFLPPDVCGVDGMRLLIEEVES